MDNNKFLRERLDLLSRKQTDANLEWQDITDFRSEYTGQLEHRDTIRKGSKLFYEYYNAGWIKEPSLSDCVKSENDDLISIRKEQIKLSDQRVEFNRQIRKEARKESFLDLVKNIICKNVEPIQIYTEPKECDNSPSLLCHLTDIHTGIEIDNWLNTFNQDVLKRRIENYISHILRIQRLHNATDCRLVIGEILSGLIHNNLRLQNNMDLMEQFKYISELISSMLVKLAESFDSIHVYVTPGNHSRVSAKKEDSLDGENFDVLLPFYLKARLQNLKTIRIHDNNIEPEIAMFSIDGVTVMASHGHKDKPATVVQNFTMMFGIKPDIVLLGHRHTNGMTTVYNTKVIESGCVSGSDQFSVSIRKTNKPEQTVSVIDRNGLVCLYDIQLD